MPFRPLFSVYLGGGEHTHILVYPSLPISKTVTQTATRCQCVAPHPSLQSPVAFHPLPAPRLPSLDSSDKWNHVCPSVSDSFPWRNVLKVRPCRSVRQKPILFLRWNDAPWHRQTTVLHPFISRWTVRLFPPFGYCEQRRASTCGSICFLPIGKHLAAAGLGGVATCVYLSECQTVFRSRHRFMFPAAICESSSSTFLPTFTLFKKK